MGYTPGNVQVGIRPHPADDQLYELYFQLGDTAVPFFVGKDARIDKLQKLQAEKTPPEPPTQSG